MKFKFKKYWTLILTACLLALMPATVIFAQTGIGIDGSFADWAAMTGLVDPGGADDENAPSDSDITEFRTYAETGGIYVLKAWDDTRFNPSGTAAGITLRNASGAYYRIYSVAQGNPASVALASLDINSCTTSACSTQVDVCSGAGCTGALAGSSTTWTDPFTGRATPACYGTNCATLDVAVELYIPWALVGGAPANNETVFLQFGSYPSGPGQAPKDDTGSNGITCRNDNGVYNCFISDPTAVTLSSITAIASPAPGSVLAVLIVLAAGLVAAALYERKLQLQAG